MNRVFGDLNNRNLLQNLIILRLFRLFRWLRIICVIRVQSAQSAGKPSQPFRLNSAALNLTPREAKLVDNSTISYLLAS